MRLLPRLLVQLVTPFLILALAILLLLGSLIEPYFREIILHTASINLELRAQSLEARLAAERRTLQTLATKSIVPDTPDTRLNAWRTLFPAADEVFIISGDGDARNSDGQRISLRARPEWAFVASGEAALTSAVASPFSGKPVVVMLEPLRGAGGRVTGAMGVTFSVDTLGTWIHGLSLYPGGVQLLVDGKGSPLVGHPEESIVPGVAADRVRAPRTAAILEATAAAHPANAWQGLQHAVAGSDWQIIVAFPEEILFAPIHRARQTGLIAILILTIAAVTAIVILHRSLIKPIRDLADAQEKLKQGECTRIDSTRRDELGQLAHSFNEMATQLATALGDARQAEARYRSLFEHAHDAILLAAEGEDGSFRFVDGNACACALFGCELAELLQSGPADFSPPTQPDGRDSRAAAAAHSHAALTGKAQLFIWQHLNKSGRRLTTEVSLKRIEMSGSPLLMAVIRDISAREATARYAREMESKFQRVFSASVDYMIVARLRDGLIVEANEGFERLTGYPPDEAIGKTTLELALWADADSREQFVADLRAASRLNDYPMAMRIRSGEVREISLSIATLDLDGEPFYVSIARDVTDERRLQRALATSEARLKTIIETTPSPICINRVTDLTYVSVNPAWEQLYGLSEVDVVGKTLSDCGFTAVNASALRQQTRQLLANGHIEGEEAEFITPDGRRVAIIYASRIIELDGEAVLISINADVSRMKEVERRLKVVVESAPAIIVINRLSDLTYLDINPEFVRLFECHPDEILGRTLQQAGFTIVNHAAVREQTERLMNLGRLDNAQGEFVTAAGKRVSIVYSSRITELEGEPVILTMAADITHIKAVEAGLREAKLALQESEQRFIVLFQSSPIALSVSLLAAESYRLSELNAAWYKTFGYSADDALGRSPIELGLWPNPIDHAGYYRQIEETGEVHDYDVWLLRKDGSALLCGLSAQRIVVGRQTLLLTACVDMTEKRRIEQEIRDLNASLENRIQQRTYELQQAQAELMRSEKLAALGSLVAGVAHELNTPIGTSLTVASTLTERSREIAASLEQGLRRSALEAYLTDVRTGNDILVRNLQRSAELIQSFKNIAVDQSSHQQRDFDLRMIVDETLAALRPSLKKKPHTVNNAVEAGLHMNSYAGSLEQVIVNLVNNAILHGFDGRDHGTVTLTGSRHDPDAVRLAVHDDGCGIASTHLSRIFDPFYTTKLGRGGSGLGLHIVRSIVEDILGGQIHVDSEIGRGTTMTLILPRHAPAHIPTSYDAPDD